jgi:hypothetical protein
MNRNPFVHADLLREPWAYGAPAAPAVGPVALHWVRVDGRGLDDYLNINMRQETRVVPVLSVDLSPLERRFFGHWQRTPSADPAIGLARLYRPITDAPFRERVPAMRLGPGTAVWPAVLLLLP